MWIWKQLNKSEADELYLKYQDNKYFKHMSKSDAMEMILDSGHFFSTEFTNVYEIEEFTSLAANIPTNLKDTGFSYLTIPCLVLEGSLYHDFSYVNGAQNVKGEILAPYLTYYTPFAYGSSTIVPRIYTSKGCNGLIVNPKLFTQIAMRNPSMYSTVLEDRERLIELMLKHMPIQYHSVPSQRIARLLLAQVPSDWTGEVYSIKISQHEIVNLLDMSRATVAKGVSFLKEKTLMSTYRGGVDVNIAQLRAYVEKG